MKSLPWIAAALIALSSQSAQAQWVAANVDCQHNGAVATCRVANTGHQPMQCRLRAEGRVASGHVVYARMEEVVLPGQYRYVYVNSAGPNNPFVAAWGEGLCRN